MEKENLENEGNKYSEHELYKNLLKYSQECPGYMKDYLTNFSTPLLVLLKPKELLETTDLFLEFLTKNKETTFENTKEIINLTRHKTLPILNNKVKDKFEENDNAKLRDYTKNLLTEEYQSIVENISTLKEEEQKEELQNKYDEMLTILDSLGEKDEPINHIQ